MNTLTQIENALKAINQATFQSLINHLLYLQNNKFIGAPGAVVGKDKTSKGTPDSFFVNDDKYIFVECTTQEKIGESKSFFNKLVKDIEHCFKEDETKIKKEKIEKVVLACNEKINTEEYNKLNTIVKSFNPHTKIDVLNIQNLPMFIYELPKLAEEYLGIQIIKGDIFSLKEFLLKTTKGIQPSLTNEFIGREVEFKSSIEVLKKHDILLLSGGAGVGKSKLAVKILEELTKDNYIPKVIQSSAVSLWDDFQHLFLHGKQYIILFDDANKSITNLNYLLDKLQVSQSYSAKVIITSRDYVKKQVSTILDNYSYTELSIPEFKDEEIGKIIVSALPNLQYHSEIKRKIIDLAKGNARIALMATYSVTPDSETNYLNSPVLLYEKYFKKISEDIGIFTNPIMLKSLAIVSFFGVLDRNNEQLRTVLSTKFNIDWNDLWSAILELHNSEILDVYSEEIVKVSDQVLATYAFYKCFIDNKSAQINYAEWITVFIEKFSHRIRATLIDMNNTFAYNHIKDLVLPHLNEVIKQVKSDKELYAFYNLFWFYKGRDCLLYLRNWIEGLPQEEYPEIHKFSYIDNDHTEAGEYFELLKNFWNHPNELLRPSLELTLLLLCKQPTRLPKILKFIHEDFKYKIEDVENGYLRQNTLLDTLLDDNLNNIQKSFVNGIFLNLSEALLGWHYTGVGPAKGNAFTVYNFNLYKSDNLMKLRGRLLNQIYNLFESENEQCQKILNQIIYPGGNIDKSIYVDELPVYQKIISEKLDNKQYAHCKFVCVLAEYLKKAKTEYPENWKDFIESDIRKLSKFLKADWEYRRGKSFEESEKEKRKEFEDFVKANGWQSLEKFLLDINALYKQQKGTNTWHIESSITNIYFSIARKNKHELENALRLFFSGDVFFPLQASVINVALEENIMSGKDLLNIIDNYEFEAKSYWKSVLFATLPEEQINESCLKLLISTFLNSDTYHYIHRMLNYLKYEPVFEEYKKGKPELENHNIITYLTSIIISRTNKTKREFGFNFCSDCAPYFSKHSALLKEVYWVQHEIDPYFDYNGKQLKAILDLDKNFINDSLKNGKIGLGHSYILRLENIPIDILWEYHEYEELIENLLLTVLENRQYTFEEDIYCLFIFKNFDEDRAERVKSLITKLTQKYRNNEKVMLMFIEIVYNNFNNWFIEYFREFLLLNKDVKATKKIGFDRSSSTVGSWVPVYQRTIEFYQEIIKMINSLPNILDYSEHIDYFEQKISRKKMEIEREQKRDFMEEYY